MDARPLAHSRSQSGRDDPVSGHLADVAEAAARFAGSFGAAEEARVAGLLHDLGKYSTVFGQRLAGRLRQVDHSSAGAWAALSLLKRNGLAAALCIQGHHIGLQQATQEAMSRLDPRRLRENRPQGVSIPAEAVPELLDQLQGDGLTLPAVGQSVYDWKQEKNTVADMLDVRMLFSTLVDADFLETEAHFQARTPTEKQYRSPGPALEPDRALAALQSYLVRLAAQTDAAAPVAQLRADLLAACLKGGEQDAGLFTLTAPTGAGKTLAMLAFALKHAMRHGLRRIVVVIPYLSIIEQTVQAYRQALAALGDEAFLRRYVLEHDSLAGTRRRGQAKEDGADPDEERLLAENWDAPIVVTTSVQMLESLFASHPAPCRKLHRLAQSVILFDEVQSLPVRLAVPTLGTLSRLSERYGASIVFSTATQPAFDHLDKAVEKLAAQRWQPREIVPTELRLFERARRTRVEWPASAEPLPWERLAQEIADLPQVLCIVNLKRHAMGLLALLKSTEGLFHLSTSMCPAHRAQVLEQVRERLKKREEPCRLIATQCVEAGVDLDFPAVYRAWGPLDAIAQAAGRCNRNGRQGEGRVHVFIPEDSRSYPDRTYEQAAEVAMAVRRQRGAGGMDIQDETLFRQYYTLLYDIAAPESLSPKLRDAAVRQDFADLDRLYRVIETDAINVLVPFDLPAYRALVAEVRAHGLTGDWVARARPYTVSLFRPRPDAPVRQWLEEIVVGERRRPSEDWFIYLGESHYDRLMGLVVPQGMEFLMA